MDIGLRNASACWIWSLPRDTWSLVHQFRGEFCWMAFDSENQRFFYVLAQVDHWQVLKEHRMSMRWRCNKCCPESEMKYSNVSFLDQTGFVGCSVLLVFFLKPNIQERKIRFKSRSKYLFVSLLSWVHSAVSTIQLTISGYRRSNIAGPGLPWARFSLKIPTIVFLFTYLLFLFSWMISGEPRSRKPGNIWL